MRNGLEASDIGIARLIENETARQRNQLVLIAAENYASLAVLEAQGSLLTNKYAEGYPGHRYYGGCREVDEVEILAIERAKRLFGAEHANVQPHSGTQANMAAYLTLLKPGDTVMAMSLSHGGHLSHGSQVNFSSQWYHFIHYGVDRETELIDYQEVARLAQEHRPRLIIAGASSYPRKIDFKRFREIAEEVGAELMVDMAHIAGLVAAGYHPSPVSEAAVITSSTHKTLRGPRGGFILSRHELARKIDEAVFPGTQGGPLMHVIAAKAVAFHEAMHPEFREYQQCILNNAWELAQELQKFGFRLVTGGTENHLILVDLRGLGITGKMAEIILESVGISVNRNAIPFDPLPPQLTSGIRLGTPAVTTRGLGADEMKQIAWSIYQVLSQPDDEKVRQKVRQEVAEISARFPVPE
jgi:glycine hydroxymethyltransferase